MVKSIELKPNLFIAGFTKCGTTSMANILSKHTSIYVPEEKELHYFDSALLDRAKGPGDSKIPRIYSLKDYLKKFEGRKEKYLVDATPAYIVNKSNMDKIYQFNNNAKI